MSTTLVCAFAIALAVLSCASCRADGSAEPSLANFAKSSVTLESSSAKHVISAWVADNDARRAQGLMFVKSLAPDTGMLFIYPEAQYVSMWMKNTYVALDMLFIDRDGRIVNIAENTRPLTLGTISSSAPVLAVLELPAGTVKRLGLRPGDRVHHATFEL
jgi:uncharacterized membrane protein (UPF0127 family)